jgi:hypothetical protein
MAGLARITAQETRTGRGVTKSVQSQSPLGAWRSILRRTYDQRHMRFWQQTDDLSVLESFEFGRA